MNRKEYIELVNEWNNFLISEDKRLLQEKLLIESLLLNENLLKKLRDQGIKKSVAIPLVLMKALMLNPTKGYGEASDPPPYEKIVDIADDNNIPGDSFDKEDYDDAVTHIDTVDLGDRYVTSGLSSISLGGGTSLAPPKRSGWRSAQSHKEVVKKGMEKLRELTQKEIDKASISGGVESLSYGMYYLRTNNMVKFKIRTKELNKFVQKYKTDTGYSGFLKVKKFIKKHVPKYDKNFDLASYSIAAIKTCQKLPDACESFQAGHERITDIGQFTGNVKTKDGVKRFNKSMIEKTAIIGESGKIFEEELRKTKNIFYHLSEQMENSNNINMSKEEGSGLTTSILKHLLNENGDVNEEEVKNLFEEVSSMGIKYFEDGHELTGINSEIDQGSAAGRSSTGRQVVNPNNIVNRQSKELEKGMD